MGHYYLRATAPLKNKQNPNIAIKSQLSVDRFYPRPVGRKGTNYCSVMSEKRAFSKKRKLLSLTPKSQVENRKQV